MSIAHFLIGWALLLALSPVSAHQERRLEVDRIVISPGTGALAGKVLYTNSHAVIIGIGQYGNLTKKNWLEFPQKDALDLREVLIRWYGFPSANVVTLINEQATKANIEKALADLADVNRVGEEDRVLIFFAGHGQTVPLRNGGQMGFLIPYDANVNLVGPMNSRDFLNSCIGMDRLWSYLEASPAKHGLLIADACFGGLILSGRALGLEPPSPAVVATLAARPALQALTAGGTNEEVAEDPKLGHGYLTYKLLEELRAQAANADSIFLASQLASALRTSVANLSEGRQTPQFGSHNHMEGDFLFVTMAPSPVPDLVTTLRPSEIPKGRLYNGPKPSSPMLGDSWINPKDGAEMAFIPGDSFENGDPDQSDNPVHTVTLSDYYIYKNDVTVAQYRKFCHETGAKMPEEPSWGWQDKHPMVNVSWKDVLAYCKWARVRPVTEAEWEHAARGSKKFKFPWGEWWDGSKCANSVKPYAANSTAPVGSHPANGFGLFDMAGNVWQWCQDSYDADFWKTSSNYGNNPISLKNGASRVVRGGSWYLLSADDFRVSFRYRISQTIRTNNVGFRCASGR